MATIRFSIYRFCLLCVFFDIYRTLQFDTSLLRIAIDLLTVKSSLSFGAHCEAAFFSRRQLSLYEPVFACPQFCFT